MTIRIIGTPRSGTNFAKFLLETRTDLHARFNLGWWKHAVIPPLMEGDYTKVDNIPTIVMFREPLEQMVSFYKYAQNSPPGLRSKAKSFSAFLRNPIYMTPYLQPYGYWFQTPIAYWIQFYWAVITWGAPKLLVDLARLKKNNDSLFPSLQTLVLQKIETRPTHEDTEKYMGKHPDNPVPGGWILEQGPTIAQVDAKRAAFLENISPEDKAAVLQPYVVHLYRQLQTAANAAHQQGRTLLGHDTDQSRSSVLPTDSASLTTQVGKALSEQH